MTIDELKLVLARFNPDSEVFLYNEMADSFKIIGTSRNQYDDLLLQFDELEEYE